MSTEHKHLSTQQVANRLVELCRQGKIDETQEELYSNDVICIEPEHAQGHMPNVKGKHAVQEKSKQFDAMIEEMHGAEISEPVVAGNWFAVSWVLEATMKGRGRQKLEEVCVYHVEEGKIVSEQFFY